MVMKKMIKFLKDFCKGFMIAFKRKTPPMLCKQQSDNFQNIMIESSTPLNELTDKREMLKLLLSGKLGNHLRTWENILEMAEETDYEGPVTIRCRRINSGLCQYHVKQNEIDSILSIWLGADENLTSFDFYFNESAPDEKLIFQGEFMRLNREYVLFMSEQKAPMREALKTDGFHMIGPKVLPYLKSKMTKESWSDFVLLHKMYHTAVIEFSVYSCNVGNRPNRNALIWKVRNY